MLTLPIKKQWFDMIVDGEKNEEYRELTPYYHSRFKRYLGEKIDIVLRNGYSRESPAIHCVVRVVIGEGQTKWGAEEGIKYYVLRIIKIDSVT